MSDKSKTTRLFKELADAMAPKSRARAGAKAAELSKTTRAGACAICGEPLERDDVFISTLDGHWFCSLPCRNKFWELNREERMKDV